MQEMDSKLLRGRMAAIVEKEPLSVHPSRYNNLFFICYLHALPGGESPRQSTAFHFYLSPPS